LGSIGGENPADDAAQVFAFAESLGWEAAVVHAVKGTFLAARMGPIPSEGRVRLATPGEAVARMAGSGQIVKEQVQARVTKTFASATTGFISPREIAREIFRDVRPHMERLAETGIAIVRGAAAGQADRRVLDEVETVLQQLAYDPASQLSRYLHDEILGSLPVTRLAAAVIALNISLGRFYTLLQKEGQDRLVLVRLPTLETSIFMSAFKHSLIENDPGAISDHALDISRHQFVTQFILFTFLARELGIGLGRLYQRLASASQAAGTFVMKREKGMFRVEAVEKE
jgi:hypothetical protein